jgi:hypothetical protein
MSSKTLRGLVVLILALISSPALADKLVFDHRLYPPLQAVLDSGRDDLILYNDKNPAYVTDLIVIRGKSTRDWTEAMIIIARSPGAKVSSVDEWKAELERQTPAQCASKFEILGRDELSITLERKSRGCPAGYPPHALYRIVRGQKSLFLLGVMSKDGITPAARDSWLALFGSARLE